MGPAAMNVTTSNHLSLQTPEGFGIVDSQGTLIYASPVCEQLYGLPLGQQIGRSIHDLMDKRIYQPSVALKVLSSSRGFTGVKETQAGFVLATTGTPILDSAGQVVAVLLRHRPLNIPEKTPAPAPKMRGSFPPSMRPVLDVASRIARIDEHAMIIGESGTGKSLFCKVIHQLSDRRDGPFVVIDCGADPDLVHTRFLTPNGEAITVTLTGIACALHSVSGGTVVLEDVTELPHPAQARLVQIMEDRSLVTSAGQPIVQAWRFLATTTHDPEEAVASGKLRPELYHRLAALTPRLPPLRERAGDIPAIARDILDELGQKYGFDKQLTPAGISRLVAYKWPGNMHELRYVLLSAATSHNKALISPEDLQAALGCDPPPSSAAPSTGLTWDKGISEAERQMILAAAPSCRTVRELASKLGLSESTLRRRVRALFGSWHNLQAQISRNVCSREM